MPSRALKLLSLTIAAVVTMGAVYYAIAEFQAVAPDADGGYSMRILRVDPDPASTLLDVVGTRQRLPAFAAALETAATEGKATIHGGDQSRAIRDYVNAESGRKDLFEQRVTFNGTHFRVQYFLV